MGALRHSPILTDKSENEKENLLFISLLLLVYLLLSNIKIEDNCINIDTTK